MKSYSVFLSLSLWGILLSPLACRADDGILVEAEESSNTSMTPNGPYKPASPDETAKLSGGQWLNGKIGDDELYAEYTVKVPKAGTYHFFARKFWQHGPFRWQFDGGDWTEARKLDIMDTVVLREYVPLTWVFLGDVPLAAGEHKFRIEIIKDPSYEFSKTYGFDCFLLTEGDLSDYLTAHPGIGGEPK